MSANLRAFLALIRWCEGTAGENGYRTMVGGYLFDDFKDHPRQMRSGRFQNGTSWKSTAAGAYQFLSTTWNEARAALDLQDFSPINQDQAAIWLIRRAGALQDVEDGRLDDALRKCSTTWASLPYAPYGQPTRSYEECERTYLAAGGALATDHKQAPDRATPGSSPSPSVVAAPAAAPIVERQWPPSATPSPANPELDRGRHMPLPIPALIALGAELLKLIPWGNKRADRIDQAAPVLVEIARQVVPTATNEQDAVQRVMSDPEMRAEFQAKVAVQWADIAPLLEHEAQERERARGFAERMTGEGPTWRAAGFGAILVLLIALIVGGGGWTLHTVLFDDATDQQTRGMIVGAIVALITMVAQYFFGSSASSRAKDATIQEQVRSR